MENKSINEPQQLETQNSPFVIKGAIGRLYFFINGVFLSLTAGIVMRIVTNLSDTSPFGVFNGILSMVVLVFALYCLGLYFVNIKKRVTDIRGFVDWPYTTLAALLSLIPIINTLCFIILAFIPSHKESNITYHSPQH